MTEDIINMRDWVRAAMDFVSENTIGMSRHWEYTDSVAWFLTEFMMCVMVFGGIMTTPVSYTHLTLPTILLV